MRYFTAELWSAIQDDDPAAHALWQQRVVEYWKQYARVRERLPQRARRFFDKPRLHDGTVLSIAIQKHRSMRLRPPIVTIEVDHPDRPSVCTLKYMSVASFEIRLPAHETLRCGLDDWGYDEVSIEGDHLRHDVLLASNLEITVVFRNVRIAYRKRAIAPRASGRT